MERGKEQGEGGTSKQPSTKVMELMPLELL